MRPVLWAEELDPRREASRPAESGGDLSIRGELPPAEDSDQGIWLASCPAWLTWSVQATRRTYTHGLGAARDSPKLPPLSTL